MPLQKVSDYIISALYESGSKHVFLVTGGFSLGLSDAIFRHGKIGFTCTHHEQAAAMAADGYARISESLGVCIVTAGPGATNTLTGVAGSWIDSIPVIFIAGQAKTSHLFKPDVRQFSAQAFETLPLVKSITKYSAVVSEVSKVKYELEKAIHLATTGRKGPVWLEIPVDLQEKFFEPETHAGYPATELQNSAVSESEINDYASKTLALLRSSSRPLLIAGAGIRAAKAISEWNALVELLGAPFTTARLAMDLNHFEHPLFVGHPGTYGDRASNFSVQTCDLLIGIGCRFSTGLVGYDSENFAKQAKRIVVDIDKAELEKRSPKPDLSIPLDAKHYLRALNDALISSGFRPKVKKWVQLTQSWKNRYPVDNPAYLEEKDGINSYHFTRVFSELAPANLVSVVDNGSCFHVWPQAVKVKQGQRHLLSSGLASMGYGLPAAIGVARAVANQDVACIAGDGAMQMNIQELQTIAHHKLPIKIIVFNNRGYLLVRLSQASFFNQNYIGEGRESGLSFPDSEKIAHAYNIPFIQISSEAELEEKIHQIFKTPGPVWVDLICPRDQLIVPRVKSEKRKDGTMVSNAFDNLFPYLTNDEYETQRNLALNIQTETCESGR